MSATIGTPSGTTATRTALRGEGLARTYGTGAAAVEAVKAIDTGSCPYAAVAAVLPASDEKKDCDGKKDCASCCDESGCEKKASDKKAGEARLNQQAKATSAE